VLTFPEYSELQHQEQESWPQYNVHMHHFQCRFYVHDVQCRVYMYDVQCRVYMVGGAEATGGPNDTAVVYTPAFHEYDDKGQRRVYVWNVTLPQHFFSRAPVNPDQREQT